MAVTTSAREVLPREDRRTQDERASHKDRRTRTAAKGDGASAGGRDNAAVKARRKAAQRWLAHAAKAGRLFGWGAALAGCLHGAVTIVQAFILATLFERLLIAGAGFAAVQTELVVFAGTLLGRALLTYIQEALAAAGARRVGLCVHNRLTTRILREGPALTRVRESGSLASAALENVLALEGYVTRYRPQRIIALVVPLMVIAALSQVNWAVAVFFAILGPLVPIAMAVVGSRAAAASTRQFETLTRMGGHFLDRLRGLTTLKLFGQADIEREAIATVAEGFRKRTMRVLRIAFLTSTSLEFFSTLALAAVAIYVGLGLVGFITIGPVGDLTLATGLFILLLAPEFFQPLRQFGLYYHDRASALGAAEVLMGLIPQGGDTNRPLPVSDKAGMPDWAPMATPTVRLSGIALKFPNGRTALEDVSLTVAAGETVALVGPSGAGKSSLIDILLGFQRATEGQVNIAGHDLADGDFAAMPALTAWAGQRPYLFHGTIAENIALGLCDPKDPLIQKAADAAHVSDFAQTLPQGLHTIVGERGFGLSGGQARRVAIARAFVKDAPLLLLDEPTANLDRDTESLVIDALKRLRQGRTTIICTHSYRLAALADRVIRIEGGRVASEDLRADDIRFRNAETAATTATAPARAETAPPVRKAAAAQTKSAAPSGGQAPKATGEQASTDRAQTDRVPADQAPSDLGRAAQPPAEQGAQTAEPDASKDRPEDGGRTKHSAEVVA